MPASTPDSSDSPPPSATPSAAGDAQAAAPPSWRTNALLFVATVASVFVTGLDGKALLARDSIVHGLQFAASLLAILVAHEMGHYVAARIHRVDASLPYFIPLPILSPFGTMGAVIRMRGVIPTRRALLDIGAAGPLAGLVLAGLGLHHLGNATGNSLFWLVWFEVLAILGSLSSRAQGPDGERAVREQIPIRTRAMAVVGLAVIAAVGHEKGSALVWAAWF